MWLTARHVHPFRRSPPFKRARPPFRSTWTRVVWKRSISFQPCTIRCRSDTSLRPKRSSVFPPRPSPASPLRQRIRPAGRGRARARTDRLAAPRLSPPLFSLRVLSESVGALCCRLSTRAPFLDAFEGARACFGANSGKRGLGSESCPSRAPERPLLARALSGSNVGVRRGQSALGETSVRNGVATCRASGAARQRQRRARARPLALVTSLGSTSDARLPAPIRPTYLAAMTTTTSLRRMGSTRC